MEITPLHQSDRSRWTELWRAYLAFYDTELPDAVYDQTWSRILHGTELHGLAARVDGEMIGITHFLFHNSAWTLTPVCYLQDLFVDSGQPRPWRRPRPDRSGRRTRPRRGQHPALLADPVAQRDRPGAI